MAIESACVQLPNEVIMPFAGYLVSRGVLMHFGSGMAGAIGCVVGSLAHAISPSVVRRRSTKLTRSLRLLSTARSGRPGVWQTSVAATR